VAVATTVPCWGRQHWAAAPRAQHSLRAAWSALANSSIALERGQCCEEAVFSLPKTVSFLQQNGWLNRLFGQ